MNKNSCKDCNERKVGCHSNCEKYKEFYKKNEEKKAIIQNNKAKDLCLTIKYTKQY